MIWALASFGTMASAVVDGCLVCPRKALPVARCEDRLACVDEGDAAVDAGSAALALLGRHFLVVRDVGVHAYDYLTRLPLRQERKRVGSGA